MAAIANTFTSTSAKMNREELSDVVSRITPEDTPIYSMIEKTTFNTTHPEWGVDELAAPAENIVPEGEEYAFDATVSPERVGNYTQIMRATGIISGSQEAADEAGRVNKIKEQKLKKGLELRKDVEFGIVNTNASVGGTTREFGSLPTWLETNVSRGATGANGGYNAGTGLTVAPTPGTRRAFTKTLLDDVAQQAYQSGANVKHLFCSPYVKSVFVTFMSDANVASFRYAASTGTQNAIIATADVYEGPFGKLMIHQNRVMSTADTSRNVFLIDPEFLQFGWFRKIKEDKDARTTKTSDAHKFVILGEGTLKVKNERGLGVVADVFGLTAST